jgi:hypothetical protein
VTTVVLADAEIIFSKDAVNIIFNFLVARYGKHQAPLRKEVST